MNRLLMWRFYVPHVYKHMYHKWPRHGEQPVETGEYVINLYWLGKVWHIYERRAA